MTFNLNDALKISRAKESNDKRLGDLIARVQSYGRDSAAGTDALPKLALDMVRAVNDGVIADITAVNDQGKDVAHQVYVEYQKAERGKNVHDMPTDKQSANGLKANVSKLRQIMAMGAIPGIDSVEVMERAVDIRKKINAEGATVKSAYPYMIDVARAQLKTDVPLSDDFLAECAMKEGKKTREKIDAIKGLETARNILEAIVTGEGNYLRSDDPAVEAAYHAVKDAITKFHVNAERAAVIAAAAKLGLTIK